MTTSEILKTAVALKTTVASLSTAEKDAALAAMADAIEKSAEEILAQNAQDLTDAEGKISRDGLKISGKTEEWLNSFLDKKNTAVGDVYFMTVDDSGKIVMIMKG